MSEDPVELAGVTVHRPISVCDIDRDDALLIQRWWEEVRKALKTASFVHATELEQFTFERFQREWTRDLKGLRAERYVPVDGGDPRPFISEDADALSAGGYVQGQRGERRFYAPDAAVLLSETFLRDHCFGVLSPTGTKEVLRLSVTPTQDRDVTDIAGILEVDTLTKELRTFAFEYVNLPDDIPSSSSAGGHLTFDYLASGAWLVSEWWVRMPWVDPRVWPSTVLAYVDEGGRVIAADSTMGPVGLSHQSATITGVVYDSLHKRPLADARVSVVGTRLATRTGEEGGFTLTGVPAGSRGLTVHHEDLVALGVPSPVVRIEVEDGLIDTTSIVIPPFTSLLPLFCPKSSEPARAILTGIVRDLEEGSEAVSAARVRARWSESNSSGGAPITKFEEVPTGPDGRYVLCAVPPAVSVSLAIRTADGWRAAGDAMLTEGQIVARDLAPGQAQVAVVRGYVGDATTGSGLSSAMVSLHGASGSDPTSIRVDLSGGFRLVVPEPGDYVVAAMADGYASLTSERIAIAAGAAIDLTLELSPSAAARKVFGQVVDAVDGRPITAAGIHLLDADGRPIALSVADSTGRYIMTLPSAGRYSLLARSPGYFEEEMPIPARLGKEEPVDLMLRSEAIELDPLTVSVRNERVIDWLTQAMGGNPAQFFGFRVIQGARLESAKGKAEYNPTETLRWLYIPVWHEGPCVSINVRPSMPREGYGGGRRSAFVPGSPSEGTVAIEERSEGEGDDCGRLFIDGVLVPSDGIEAINMRDIAVVTTLPGEVRMFSYDFEWTFRRR